MIRHFVNSPKMSQGLISPTGEGGAFVALQPDEGLIVDKYVKSLTEILENASDEEVHTAIPKDERSAQGRGQLRRARAVYQPRSAQDNDHCRGMGERKPAR